MDFLDNLRKKPLHVRRSIAVVTTGLLSFVIMTVWVNSWGAQHRMAQSDEPNAKTPTELIVKKIVGLKEKGTLLWDSGITQITQAAAVASVDIDPNRIPEYVANPNSTMYKVEASTTEATTTLSASE